MNIFQKREQILADLIEAYKEHDEEKTNNLLDQLKELDKPAERWDTLPEEPEESGYYLAANDGRLFRKDSDDDWSAVESSAFWNGNHRYAKWPEVCAQLPPEAFPLKRVNTGDGDDD